MTLRLHPDMLAAGYEYLRALPPFTSWNLPEADEIGFNVMRDPSIYADFSMMNGVPTISVSVHKLGAYGSILSDVAHEMIHLHQHRNKLARGGGAHTHNADFRRRAKRVCALHGFDIRTF